MARLAGDCEWRSGLSLGTAIDALQEASRLCKEIYDAASRESVAAARDTLSHLLKGVGLLRSVAEERIDAGTAQFGAVLSGGE